MVFFCFVVVLISCHKCGNTFGFLCNGISCYQHVKSPLPLRAAIPLLRNLITVSIIIISNNVFTFI